ncbi:unnamed protein product [Rotaria socialis]
MLSSSTQKQPRHRINNNSTQQSRNANAYFDGEEYHRQSLMNKTHYWNRNFHMNDDDDYYYYYNYHQPLASRPMRKERLAKSGQRYDSKADFSSSSNNNNNYSYYDNIPPRHRLQQPSNKREQRSSRLQEPKLNTTGEINPPNSSITKPSKSASSSSTNSDMSNNVGSTQGKDLHSKNLTAARQQNSTPPTNLSTVQTLMNSLMSQQQQPSTPAQSTVQLQYQLTNALLGIMIQQRVKETALQAQAQQIQAVLPTLLAAQALVYQQQQGQLTNPQQPTQSILSSNMTHPGTKFNNRPLVTFPVARPTMPVLSPTMMMPILRPSITTNFSRHRLATHSQQIRSTTTLPTYQQVQEIERGISLDEAIHLKGAIDIADLNKNSITAQTEVSQINDRIIE